MENAMRNIQSLEAYIRTHTVFSDEKKEENIVPKLLTTDLIEFMMMVTYHKN